MLSTNLVVPAPVLIQNLSSDLGKTTIIFQFSRVDIWKIAYILQLPPTDTINNTTYVHVIPLLAKTQRY